MSVNQNKVNSLDVGKYASSKCHDNPPESAFVAPACTCDPLDERHCQKGEKNIKFEEFFCRLFTPRASLELRVPTHLLPINRSNC